MATLSTSSVSSSSSMIRQVVGSKNFDQIPERDCKTQYEFNEIIWSGAGYIYAKSCHPIWSREASIRGRYVDQAKESYSYLAFQLLFFPKATQTKVMDVWNCCASTSGTRARRLIQFLCEKNSKGISECSTIVPCGFFSGRTILAIKSNSRAGVTITDWVSLFAGATVDTADGCGTVRLLKKEETAELTEEEMTEKEIQELCGAFATYIRPRQMKMLPQVTDEDITKFNAGGSSPISTMSQSIFRLSDSPKRVAIKLDMIRKSTKETAVRIFMYVTTSASKAPELQDHFIMVRQKDEIGDIFVHGSKFKELLSGQTIPLFSSGTDETLSIRIASVTPPSLRPESKEEERKSSS